MRSDCIFYWLSQHIDLPSPHSHLGEPPSRFYRDGYGPESLTPNYTHTVHLPPQNSQFDTPRWISSSRKPDVPKRPMDLEFMTRLAKLRQQTQGTSSGISSASWQVGQKYTANVNGCRFEVVSTRFYGQGSLAGWSEE